MNAIDFGNNIQSMAGQFTQQGAKTGKEWSVAKQPSPMKALAPLNGRAIKELVSPGDRCCCPPVANKFDAQALHIFHRFDVGRSCFVVLKRCVQISYNHFYHSH